MELYIHIPFCRQKCRYCSFASFTGQEAYFKTYIDLLLKEAVSRKTEATEPINTIYIGGGTPSLLPPEILSDLVCGLRSVFDLTQVVEFTSESNPGTVTKEWLDTAVSLGINRLSLGMQAYQDRILHLLGRIHCYDDVVSSVLMARSAGFVNINLDLIFGVPSQTICEWSQTIDAAMALIPQHISAYGLIPEEGTPLFSDLEKGLLTLPDSETERKMYDLFIRKATVSRLRQYEISNFARETYSCLHNIGYWTQIPYIGLGVSAASMTGVRYSPDGMSYNRTVNPDTIEAYENMILSGRRPESESVSPAGARFETMMLGLRMNCGVNEKEFFRKHGLTMDQCYGEKLEKLKCAGLFLHEGNVWKLTSRGFDIQNSILVELMDE